MLYTVGGKKQICIEKVVATTTTNAKFQVWKSIIILYCPGPGITAFLPFLPELSCKLFFFLSSYLQVDGIDVLHVHIQLVPCI